MRKSKSKEFRIEDLKSQSERNKIARDLEPLMHKIVNQWEGKCPLDREMLEMQARYGVVYAMNNYREGTTQTFLQYAAWCIRNWILNGINEFGSTVRIGACERKKLMDNGDTVYRTSSIDEGGYDDNGDMRLMGEIARKCEYNQECEIVTQKDAMDRLVKYVDKRFDKRHKDVFFSTYALKGKKLMKGVELAEKYHCTAALISQLNRDVLESIRKNPELIEILDAVRG